MRLDRSSKDALVIVGVTLAFYGGIALSGFVGRVIGGDLGTTIGIGVFVLTYVILCAKPGTADL